jgi:hypothetical protein
MKCRSTGQATTVVAIRSFTLVCNEGATDKLVCPCLFGARGERDTNEGIRH